MKSRAFLTVMILGAFASAFHQPALAQNAVGGPTKRTAVGGPVKQSSPVVPPNKGASIPVSAPSQVKCAAGPCAAKATKH